MKIGIIGAENSHTAAIAKTINVDKKIRGFTVDYVWGETTSFAKNAAEKGQIPNIVRKPEEMLGKIDAVLADHRHPKYHVSAVKPFVEKGIPTFVDKPFCYRTKEGKELLKIAKKHKTPITSFSVLPHQKSFKTLLKGLGKLGNIYSATSYGSCGLKNKYGGIYFYGIHQVEAVLQAFGYDVKSVLITKNGNVATGQLLYNSGMIVTMNLIEKGCKGFHICATGETGFFNQALTFDQDIYLEGIKTFTKMFKTGVEPMTYEQMLKPVQVLEALEKSIKSGKIEKLPK